MSPIFSIAWKDIRLLLSDRLAAFFVLGFPILMGLFFGNMMNVGDGGKKARMKVSIVDQDNSEYSQALVASLKNNANIEAENDSMETARSSVQSGKRIGMIVIPAEFGKTAGLFWEEQKSIQVGLDPSRSAEGAMLEGFVMEAMGTLFGKRFSQPTSFLGPIRENIDQVKNDSTLDENQKGNLITMFDSLIDFSDAFDKVQSSDNESKQDPNKGLKSEVESPAFKMASIERLDVTRAIDPNSREGQTRKVRKGWDISFPQAMLWGVLGCAAGFAISLAQEREAGTLLRLQIAPISQAQILSGKALACFLSILFVISVMTGLGLWLGMQPLSFPKLGVAAIAVSLCFVGIMMTLSTLGRSVQSVSGIGWALNMIMAMFGGCMIPVMFMPEFINRISILSPVRWAIAILEGAIWRDFSWSQIGLHASLLLGIGLAGLVIGVWNHRKD